MDKRPDGRTVRFIEAPGRPFRSGAYKFITVMYTLYFEGNQSSATYYHSKAGNLFKLPLTMSKYNILVKTYVSKLGDKYYKSYINLEQPF